MSFIADSGFEVLNVEIQILIILTEFIVFTYYTKTVQLNLGCLNLV